MFFRFNIQLVYTDTHVLLSIAHTISHLIKIPLHMVLSGTKMLYLITQNILFQLNSAYYLFHVMYNKYLQLHPSISVASYYF